MATTTNDALEKHKELMKPDALLGNHNFGYPLVLCHGFWLDVGAVQNYRYYYNFNFREDDVFVVSPPKCGTHWLYYAIYLLVTKNYGDVPQHQQLPILEFMHRFDKCVAEGLEQETERRVIATHMPAPLLPKNAFRGKVIYVYRNPKDVAISLFHHHKNHILWPFDVTFDEWIEIYIKGETSFGPYPEHVKEMLKLKKEMGKSVLFVSYEEMKKDSVATLKKLGDYLSISPTDEEISKILELTSVENMRKNEQVNGHQWRATPGAWNQEEHFIRKGKVGSWRENFQNKQELLEKFEKYISDNFPRELF